MSTTSSSSLPSNKSYSDLANEAILCLQKRSGSSLQAIKRYIQTQYPDLDLKSNYLRAALKKAISQERIVQVKGSFRISPGEKKVLMKRRSIMSIVKTQSSSLSSHLQARTKQQSKSPAENPVSAPPSPSKTSTTTPRKIVLRTPPLTLRSSNIKRRLRSSTSPSYSFPRRMSSSPSRGRGILA
jgi:histone H1/5